MLKTVTPGEALSILYSAFGARRTEAEACPLALARGRVLAEDVEAAEFVPGFDRSSVDGYALAAADTFGCGRPGGDGQGARLCPQPGRVRRDTHGRAAARRGGRRRHA